MNQLDSVIYIKDPNVEERCVEFSFLMKVNIVLNVYNCFREWNDGNFHDRFNNIYGRVLFFL